MRLILTRAMADARSCARLLAPRGVTAIIAPLLIIRHDPPLRLAACDATILTSRNAVAALAAHPDLRRIAALPAYCVGAATAAAARRAGFATVIAGPGNGAMLCRQIAATAPAGPLLHFSGASIAFDMAAALRPLGVRVERQIVYRADPPDALPVAAADALRRGEADAVALLSPRTASSWAGLVAAAGCGPAAMAVTHYCLSPAIAAALAPFAPHRILIAQQPTMRALLALLCDRSDARVQPSDPQGRIGQKGTV